MSNRISVTFARGLVRGDGPRSPPPSRRSFLQRHARGHPADAAGAPVPISQSQGMKYEMSLRPCVSHPSPTVVPP